MKIHSLILIWGVVCSAALSPAADAKSRTPNIILFLSDDHSLFDTGCYGNDLAPTPHIDQLASEGMRYDRAFTSTAMCAPARSMLYTGLYPHRNGCHMNHGATKEGTRSIPQYLKPLGYRVVLAGKKHIRPRSVYPFEYIEQDEIAKVINGPQPFCLIIASNNPHPPHQQGGFKPEDVPIPPYGVDTPALRENLAGYYTDIQIMDHELGEALDLLRRSGREDQTVLIYTSDHGQGLMAKWSCYEAGLRVPWIVRWPGHITAGSTTKAMISFVDVLPTFIELAGGTPPKDIDGKSFLSVLIGETNQHRRLIFGTHTNQGIIHGGPYPIRSVRDARYKYIRNLLPEGRATNGVNAGPDLVEYTNGIWGEWRALATHDKDAARLAARVMTRPMEELYDLDEDPWELTNLAGRTEYAAIKKRLSGELDQWMKQQGDAGLKAEMSVPPHSSVKVPVRLRESGD